MNALIRRPVSPVSRIQSICFAIGLIVLALSSTAIAQVNGPGTSDSSLFDTVINVPEDQVVISGALGGDGLTTQVNLSDGGSASGLTTANSGTEFNVFGGVVSSFFNANSGSEINISGGVVANGFQANAGSLVEIIGGDVSNNFTANAGSLVNISGGNVGPFFDAQSSVNISGGSVGGLFGANFGSQVDISGGSVESINATSGGQVNVGGGSVGSFNALEGSLVTVEGGSLGDFDAFSGSETNISGGSFGGVFSAFSESDVNLFGTEFLVDGVLLDGLELGESFEVDVRDVTLSGLLSDGSSFEFELISVFNDDDFFASDANLTVTLTAVVPEPGVAIVMMFGGIGSLLRRRNRAS